LLFISDNCDSLGTQWNGQGLPSWSVASSCSFYPSHHITTGEGGMVMSTDEELISIARSFAWWGRDCYCVGSANTLACGTCGNRFDVWLDTYDGIIDHKYVFKNMGYNLKPLDLQGAIGLIQLDKFDEIHRLRVLHKNKIQGIIEDYFGDHVHIPNETQGAATSWFGVPVICSSRDMKEYIVSKLEENRVQTRHYFAGNLLMHPAYRHMGDYKDYPNACQVLDRVFFLGCSPQYTPEVISYIESVVSKIAEAKKRTLRVVI
jgi:CDP-6-deoxy-D-xylo-4-hexulose-3-dehydrase